MNLIILGEPNNPWICMAEGQMDWDTFARLLNDGGYSVRPGQNFTHEHWFKDEDGSWVKCSAMKRNAKFMTVARW